MVAVDLAILRDAQRIVYAARHRRGSATDRRTDGTSRALRDGRLSPEGAGDGWAGNREQFREIADGIIAGVVHAAQFLLLLVGELRPLAAQLAAAAGDRHALAGAQPDEVGFELREGGKDVEEHL